jgi:hypothetical protein
MGAGRRGCGGDRVDQVGRPERARTDAGARARHVVAPRSPGSAHAGTGARSRPRGSAETPRPDGAPDPLRRPAHSRRRRARNGTRSASDRRPRRPPTPATTTDPCPHARLRALLATGRVLAAPRRRPRRILLGGCEEFRDERPFSRSSSAMRRSWSSTRLFERVSSWRPRSPSVSARGGRGVRVRDEGEAVRALGSASSSPARTAPTAA